MRIECFSSCWPSLYSGRQLDKLRLVWPSQANQAGWLIESMTHCICDSLKHECSNLACLLGLLGLDTILLGHVGKMGPVGPATSSTDTFTCSDHIDCQWLTYAICRYRLVALDTTNVQGVPKCPIATFSLNLFQRSNYTFSHVFRNQNFEPIPSKHIKHTHSEY